MSYTAGPDAFNHSRSRLVEQDEAASATTPMMNLVDHASNSFSTTDGQKKRKQSQRSQQPPQSNNGSNIHSKFFNQRMNIQQKITQ